MERDTGYWMNGIAFGFLWPMRDIMSFSFAIFLHHAIGSDARDLILDHA